MQPNPSLAIFRVAPDYSVLKHEDAWAIGSGMHYALGAIHSTLNGKYDDRINSLSIAKDGVLAAIAFCDGCGGDVYYKEGKIE